MPELATEIKNDTRPRHVRLAEQEFRRGLEGGVLRIDSHSSRARLYSDSGQLVTRLDSAQIDDCIDALYADYQEHFSTVRDGLYAEDTDSSEHDREPDSNHGMTNTETETLTAEAIANRWPWLHDYYQNPEKQIYQAGYNNKINRVEDVSPIAYALDERFERWLAGVADRAGIDLNAAENSPDAAEARFQAEPEVDTDSTDPAFATGAIVGAIASRETPDTPEPAHAHDNAPKAESDDPETPTGPQGDGVPPEADISYLQHDSVTAYGDGITPSDTIYVVPQATGQAEDEARLAWALLPQAAQTREFDELDDTIDRFRQKVVQLFRTYEAITKARDVLAEATDEC